MGEPRGIVVVDCVVVVSVLARRLSGGGANEAWDGRGTNLH